MALKPTDTILGPSRGSYLAAVAFAANHAHRGEEVASYLHETYRLAPLVGMDPAILVSQSAHETGNWTSPAWVNRLNPAGLGITDGPDFGFKWDNGTDAARAQIVHMAAYVYGDTVFSSPLSMPSPISDYTHLDPRMKAVFDANLDGTVRTIADLTGKWATDTQYHTKVAAKGNAIFPGIPDQGGPDVADLTFGNVERPAIIDMIVPKPYEGAGFTRVPARRCVGACDHITDGDASLEWYAAFFGTGGQRQYDALTDFGIDKQGRIAMWNDPFGTRSPWASGGSDGLEGDGPLFVRTLGIGGINGAIASTEHVGRSPAKMTDAQLEASARLKAWLFDGASNHPRGSKVPWSSFPLNPHVGCVTHMQHWEFATKPCPGPGIRGQTDALQNRIRALLKQGQEGESQGEIPPPAPVEPDHDLLPPGIDWSIVADRFGVGELHRAGKPPGHFGFHRGRAWAEAYIARASEQQEWPAVVVWNQYEDAPDRVRDIITFANGWLLVRLNAREGWRWA